MLIQNPLTGQFHEVPDPVLGEAPPSYYGAGQAQMAYDRLGNPLGLWAALAAKALPLAAKFLPKVWPKVSSLIPRVARFLPQVGRGMPQLPVRAAPQPMPQPAAVPQAAALPDIPPDAAEPEPELGEMVYDGLGNPVGFMPSYGFRPPGISFRPPSLPAPTPGVYATAPRVGMLAPQPPSGLAQLRARYLPALQQTRQLLQQAQSQGQPPDPALVERYRRLLYHYRRGLQGLRGYRGMPTGWVRPGMPYTGLGPTRMYMRCATWPGPAGLVPATAAQATPAAAAPAAAGRRGRRRGRRR
jgi:hypothetical protein